MEFISTNQLQKYEGIIEMIKCQFEKYDLLQQDLKKENDNLIISQLATSAINQKLSHLNIQVFDKFSDLLNLYGDELQNELFNTLKVEDSKFYMIEIFITKSLMQKAKGLKCMLHIVVKNKNVNINKTVALKNKTPIREVILVDNDIINSIVEINLLVPSEFKWIVIKLDTVYVDISYHFQIYKKNFIHECKAKHILQITKSYNNRVINQDLQQSLVLETTIFCEVENNCFISSMLKNCYHLLDLELFFELNNNADKEFVLKLSDGTEPFTLKFNRRQKYLKLEGNIYKLCLLKQYFLKEFYQDAKVQKNFTSDVLKIVKIKENIPQIPQEISAIFSEVRGCWSKLPI